ncbi:MAG: LLM class flavin-dependent oxidoreductase, partial [Acidimicrobiales bacterium]
EFGPFGEETDPRARGDLLDEGLDLLAQIWSGEPVAHAGPQYRVDGLRFLPRPRQPGGVPLWAATESTRGRAVRRAARLDGVFPIGLTPEQVPELLASIDASRPTEKRDRPFDVVVMEGDHPGPWAETGVTWWLRLLPYDLPLAEARRIVASGPPAV